MKAVLFDLFGTLIPNIPPAAFAASTAEIAGDLGGDKDAVREALKDQFPRRMTGEIPDGPRQFERLADELGLEVDEEALATAAATWRRMIAAQFVPKPGALALLTSLRGQGIRLGLVTDCSTGTKDIFDESPLGEHFQACAYSAWLGLTKPDARMYLHVVERLEVRAEDCWYVGDGNSRELEGARELGMRTVWVDNGVNQHVHVRFDNRADHAITELGQLLDIEESGGPS